MLKNYVDIVFANSEEARELLNEPKSTNTRDVAEKCADYLAKYCKVAVVMMGKDGCWVKSGNEKYACPADVVANPIDTTGAGDLFAAGFLYGYLQGYTLQQCARLGSLSGREVVKVLGAEVPMERFRQIKAHVNSQVFNSDAQGTPSLGKFQASQSTSVSNSLKIKKGFSSQPDLDQYDDDAPVLSGSFKSGGFMMHI